MPLAFLIVLTTTHFENANFVVFAMRQNCHCDSCTGHQGCADLEFSAVADCQNLIDHNLLAYVRSNLFYFNFFASSNTILFATGFYDRVHVRPLDKNLCGYLRTDFRRARNYSSDWPGLLIPIIQRHLNAFYPFFPSHALSTTPSNPLALISADMAEVDRVIAQRLDSGVPLVGTVSQYIISAGGKRIRPALLLLMAGALGYTDAQRHNLAAVVEFIHTATLLHDDVVDESTLRRGRPTANESFGNPASVLVGDFLYSRAFQMMVDSGEMRVMEVLAEATNVIAEGEVLQLMNMHDASLDEAGYLRVIRSKTAKLFEASTRLAAILAKSSPDVEAACADYGQALGTAFQVIDDVLDYDGDAKELGKNLGDDLREGKNTLPLIIAMQRGTPAQRQTIQSAIENGEMDALAEIVEIVRNTGALDATRAAASAEAERAIAALNILPTGPYREAMHALAAQLLDRRN